MATICGMSVIFTTLPDHQAATPPMTMARMMSPKFCMPGVKKVTRVATTMPMPAHTMPLRAVTGEAMAFRPRMNSTATTK